MNLSVRSAEDGHASSNSPAKYYGYFCTLFWSLFFRLCYVRESGVATFFRRGRGDTNKTNQVQQHRVDCRGCLQRLLYTVGVPVQTVRG